MAELLFELFSEEIPARMQARAAFDLARLVTDALEPLAPEGVATFHGPRRIALVATVRPAVPESRSSERGPRLKAPDAALDGFLRKHNAGRDDLQQEGDHWVLHRTVPAQNAASLVAEALPPLLWRFPWPKSMRWGRSTFTWVRPLRRILCLLDGQVVPFALAHGDDDGHGLRSGAETEGHRFHAPGPFPVASFTEWEEGLRARRVIPEAGERRRLVAEGIERLATERQLQVVPDDGLLDEVAGLVEWPVPLLGRIDDAFMDLPPEVMQVSMRVNQRYFALRTPEGAPAPFFAFAANVEADDGGATIIAGNERVLRARFSDARHFWDTDRRIRLEDRIPALDGITFHAKLGTQGERVRRIVALTKPVSGALGASPPYSPGFDPGLAARAALLCKADLTTEMVGEFPELQGVMGAYYARHDNEDPRVAAAIRDHYLPEGPSDPVPSESVAIAVSMSDKLDQLLSFFAVGEKPTGSSDPYALRRAALGLIRVLRENRLYFPLEFVLQGYGDDLREEVQKFLLERLRVVLRSEGLSHDVVDAALHARSTKTIFDIRDIADRCATLGRLLSTTEGASLTHLYRRAYNILANENKVDGPHKPTAWPLHGVDDSPESNALESILTPLSQSIFDEIKERRYEPAMSEMAKFRAPLDAFLDHVRVNDPDATKRRHRLGLLARLVDTMNIVADFSRIEG